LFLLTLCLKHRPSFH